MNYYGWLWVLKIQNPLMSADQYNFKFESVSAFAKKHSISEAILLDEFDNPIKKNMRPMLPNPCDQYQACVQKKFLEEGISGSVTTFLSGGLSFTGALIGGFSGAAVSAIWHATFGDCAAFRELC